jgi:hypothetical protein
MDETGRFEWQEDLRVGMVGVDRLTPPKPRSAYQTQRKPSACSSLITLLFRVRQYLAAPLLPPQPSLNGISNSDISLSVCSSEIVSKKFCHPEQDVKLLNQTPVGQRIQVNDSCLLFPRSPDWLRLGFSSPRTPIRLGFPGEFLLFCANS